MDGRDEYIYSGTTLNAYIHSKNGMLFELDYLPKRWNYMDTLSRSQEYYHSYVEKDNGYDWYLRKSFIDHFPAAQTDISSFSKMKYEELGNFINTFYSMEVLDSENSELILKRDGHIKIWDTLYPIQIIKKYIFQKNQVEVHYTLTNKSDTQLVLFFGIEVNLALGSHRLEESEIIVTQKDTKVHITQIMQELNEISSYEVKDLLNNVSINMQINNPCSLWSFPVETISQSIDTLDRIYQSTCFMHYWNFILSADASWQTAIVMKLKNGPVSPRIE
jgi:alpha-amylase